MNAEPKFEAPTWNQTYNMLLKLADKIRKTKFRPHIIVGVSRGGWPPARILSDLLSNPNLANVRAEFYLGVAETKSKPTITQPVSMSVVGKKVLVVDEVTDTGQSLELVRKHMNEKGASQVRTATIYYKPWSTAKPDYYERKTSSWIVLPWEIKETIRRILKKPKEENASFEKERVRLVEAGIPDKLVRRFLKEILEEENC